MVRPFGLGCAGRSLTPLARVWPMQGLQPRPTRNASAADLPCMQALLTLQAAQRRPGPYGYFDYSQRRPGGAEAFAGTSRPQRPLDGGGIAGYLEECRQ